MVMGVLVNGEGQVCIAHDMDYDGNPVCMSYSPDSRTMTVLFDTGTQKRIMSGTIPEICKMLQKTRSVLLKQMQAGTNMETTLPMVVMFDTAHASAM